MAEDAIATPVVLEGDTPTPKPCTCGANLTNSKPRKRRNKSKPSNPTPIKKERKSVTKKKKDLKKSNNECNRCGKEFKTKGGLKVHLAAHVRDDEQMECKTCHKKFRKQEALDLHEKTDHGGYKPHKCTQCDKTFRLKDKLKLHVMIIHEGKKPFPCPKCEKSFRTNYHLKIHDVSQHIQGVDSIGCSQCKRKFSDREALEKHVEFHKEEKPFLCDICDKGFKTGSKLKSHKKSHESNASHLCPVCGRTYKHERDLKLHEVLHQDESNYRFGCGDCSRRFYRIDLLRVHQSNEKHFSAEIVGPTLSKSASDWEAFDVKEETLDDDDLNDGGSDVDESGASSSNAMSQNDASSGIIGYITAGQHPQEFQIQLEVLDDSVNIQNIQSTSSHHYSNVIIPTRSTVNQNGEQEFHFQQVENQTIFPIPISVANATEQIGFEIVSSFISQ